MFKAGERYEENGRTFENIVGGNAFIPSVWPEGWRELFPEESPEDVFQPLTMEQIQAYSMLKGFGVFLPEKTELQIHESLIELTPYLNSNDGAWEPGQIIRRYYERTFNGKTYTAIKPHITQVGWEPPGTPSLWVQIISDWEEWQQPQGAHDAWQKGARVTHNNQRWISIITDNVWPPGIYGWTMYEY